ncbi:beta-ketoacyl synthase chain length factor [Stenotrophomonas sp. HITSZ_GD]|uniref:beta-ketoacyl synthase chain length factor n=1 Tax=Stenotrophomonas sp. HITSZ_GD TaxID=3037248 RepID=UPI00240E4313|nr:beta-ketoacyl synthase chain length factor [Stenotrophomonas sp. HITSZ_GD]MDG2525349.1 beta-ketoacyl synthase chain length factor [Stenotrophomonas sp. HITSZ_GD]
MIEFSVTGWSAWAPGLPHAQDWLDWARGDARAPSGDGAPALADVPPVMRRRIDRLGRMAISATDDCDVSPVRENVPLVFVSRHGDVDGSVELLRALGQTELLSPTAFSLSVHNAVAALYSIVRKRRGNYLALAGGAASVENACVEAAGLLADGAPEVLLVCYDGQLPDIYADFADEPAHAYAWCWRLAAPDQPGERLSLSWAPTDLAPAPASPLQHGLAVHHFLLSGQPRLDVEREDQRWRWHRHA